MISASVDALIYSPAAPENDPERLRARELGISELSYPEALALVTRDLTTIAISGTHGKSTTTALTGILFTAGGFEPSVIVGAEVPNWPMRNLLLAKSDLFIVEACEYRRNMLNLSPQAIVLTNLELDHPDYYRDLADVKHAFREYIAKLTGEDLLIINNDDANIRDVVANSDAIIVRYGVGVNADLMVHNIRQEEGGQTFDLVWKGSAIGTFSTPLPGIYNIYNILAAIAVYLAYGGKQEVIRDVLLRFHGIGRRFEILGTLGTTTIISDYAHHPTALKAVVGATLARFTGKRVLVVFRPHHRERTVRLMEQFIETLAGIPHMILVEIYDVAGREEATPISSRDVIARVVEKHPYADIVYASDLEEAESIARAKAAEFDVILVIGAGDADRLAKRLLTPTSL